MKVDFNSNYTNSKSAQASFGAINLLGGSHDVLKNALKPEQWRTFEQIVEKYNIDGNDVQKIRGSVKDIVDINFFAKGEKSLDARIISNNNFIPSEMKSQRLFEGVLGFINRCCKKADKMQAKIDRIKDIDVDKILKKV